MAQVLISKQLKSPDPKKRYQAIKHIARTGDESMLDLLEQVAQDDPDAQVRLVAVKARQFIQSAESAPSTKSQTPVTTSEPVILRSVSQEDEARAKEYVNKALSFQMKGENNKALKALAKALQLNPNLREESFFVSVLDATTGLSGEDSLKMLHDETELKNIQVSEQQMKKELRSQDHWSEVKKSTWVSVAFDLGIYTCILIAGAVLAILVLGQSANGVITGYNASVDAYWDAVNAGQKGVEPPEPVDPAFWLQAQELSIIELPTAMTIGLIVGVASLVGLLIQLVMTHVAAKFIFRGEGTLPHLIFRVVSTYNTNLPIIFVLSMIGIILSYSLGSNVIGAVFSGILGLYSLKLSFQIFSRVGQAYNFGLAKGFMAMLVGGVVVAILSAVVQIALWSTLTGWIASSMA